DLQFVWPDDLGQPDAQPQQSPQVAWRQVLFRRIHLSAVCALDPWRAILHVEYGSRNDKSARMPLLRPATSAGRLIYVGTMAQDATPLATHTDERIGEDFFLLKFLAARLAMGIAVADHDRRVAVDADIQFAQFVGGKLEVT